MTSLNFSIVLLTISILLMFDKIRSATSFKTDDEAWQAWKVDYNKSYESSEEEAQRRQIWTNKVDKVNAHNEAYAKGLESYSQAVYAWADEGDDDSRIHLNNKTVNLTAFNWTTDKQYNWSDPISSTNVPDMIDFRELGYVSSVDDQRNCGSCWAFVVAGTMEGLMKKTTGTLTKLSTQQIIDCNILGQGCYGGQVTTALLFFENHGAQADCDYPYVAERQTCKYTPYRVVFKSDGFVVYPFLDEATLKNVLATTGPVSTHIVSTVSFRDYKGDVYSTNECYPFMIPDHSVLLVGYGTDEVSRKDYWIIKNSYGTGWGENGYM